MPLGFTSNSMDEMLRRLGGGATFDPSKIVTSYAPPNTLINPGTRSEGWMVGPQGAMSGVTQSMADALRRMGSQFTGGMAQDPSMWQRPGGMLYGGHGIQTPQPPSGRIPLANLPPGAVSGYTQAMRTPEQNQARLLSIQEGKLKSGLGVGREVGTPSWLAKYGGSHPEWAARYAAPYQGYAAGTRPGTGAVPLGAQATGFSPQGFAGTASGNGRVSVAPPRVSPAGAPKAGSERLNPVNMNRATVASRNPVLGPQQGLGAPMGAGAYPGAYRDIGAAAKFVPGAGSFGQMLMDVMGNRATNLPTFDEGAFTNRFNQLAAPLGLQEQDMMSALRGQLAAGGRDPSMGGGLMSGLGDIMNQFQAQRSGLMGNLLMQEQGRIDTDVLNRLNQASGLRGQFGQEAVGFRGAQAQEQAAATHAAAQRYAAQQQAQAQQLAHQLGLQRLQEEQRQFNINAPMNLLGTMGGILGNVGQMGMGGMGGFMGQLGQLPGMFPSFG